MVGYLLTADMNAKKFVLLQGVGDSGKSVLGRFISSFFNVDSTASVDIFSLGERFALYGLVGKRINASLDLPSGKLNVQSISIIKQLTGGDALTAEAKYETPFKFENTCKLVFASNHQLRTTEVDEAFEKRCLVIPFKYAIPKKQQDHSLSEKLENEKQAIAMKALLHYKNLKNNNYEFIGEEFILQESEIVMSEEKSILFFINECCEFSSQEEKTFTSTLYDAYITFCKDRRLPYCSNIVSFSEILKKNCGSKIVPSKWRNKAEADGPQNGYKGIVLK